MHISIRPATVGDSQSMYAISCRAHLATYYDELIPAASQAAFTERYTWSWEKESAFTYLIAQRLVHPDWYALVAEKGGIVIGYTLALRESAHKLVLRALFVDPSEQTKGVGAALFEASLALARTGDTIELSVIQNNMVARRLYSKYNFTERRKDDKVFFGAKRVIMDTLIR